MFETIVNDLEKYLQVSLITEEKKGEKRYLLVLNDETEVWIQDVNDAIFLTANICPFEEKKLSSPEEFYSYLMQANYLGQGTANSVISCDQTEKFLTLSHLIDYEVNYKMFRNVLEDFTNYLTFWKKEIPKKV